MAVGRSLHIACERDGNCYVSIFGDRPQVIRVSAAGNVSHFAGSGVQAVSGDGGPARTAALELITGLAVDGQSNVYISGPTRIRKVNAAGIITTAAGIGPTAPASEGPLAIASTISPSGIAADLAGNLYVAHATVAILKIDPAGFVTRLAGTGVSGYDGDGGPATAAKVQPSSVAVDGLGNVFFADVIHNRLRKISPAGNISTIAGTGSPGFSGDGGPAAQAAISGFFSVSADAAGNVYLAETEGRIRRVNPAGIITTIAGSPLSPLGDGGPATAANVGSPGGVSVDANGNLYITSTNLYRVRKVNAAGTITTHAGNGLPTFSGDGGQATAAGLFYPKGVAPDSNGNVYIADLRNGRVRKVSPAGILTTFAEGITPNDVAVDSSGNVYVADDEAHRIWKFTPGGSRSSIAGGGTNFVFGRSAPADSVYISPSSVAVASNGEVYAVDLTRVIKVSGGQIIAVAGTEYTDPAGDGTPALKTQIFPVDVAVDGQGNVYIGEYMLVRKVTPSGNISIVAGKGEPGLAGDGGPATAAQMIAVTDVAVDPAGNLYIGDYRRVRKVDSAGTIQTVVFDGTVGNAGEGGHPLGAQVAQYPEALAFDGSGNLLIADAVSRVWKVNFAANAGPAPPVIHDMVPSVAGAGTEGRTLSLTGGNFTAQSIVRWNGSNRVTTFRNANTLEAAITSSDLAQPGTAQVTVSTPGAGASAGLAFSIAGEPRPAVPVILSPLNGSTNVSLNPVLSWAPSVGATAYDVFFGTTGTPSKIATVTSNFLAMSGLALYRGYYWSVTARNRLWETSSALQVFQTGDGTVTDSGLRFVPVTPCRVADTRAGQGTAGSFGPPSLAANSTREIPIPAGRCLIPASAKAYSLNVTVVPQEPLAYLSLWPAGQARPLVSTLNSFHGGVVANAAIVPAGTDGSIQVFVTNATDVILDINGYFEPANGYGFYPVDPCRAADTRAGSGFTGAFGGPTPAAQSSRAFPLAGVCGLQTNAAAYSLNATVVPPGPLSFLTIWGTGQAQPFVSTLNSFDGAIVANAALVPAGTGGAVSAFVTDRTDVILDVNGYFGPAGMPGALSFNPVTPCRVADTRVNGPVMTTGEQRSFTIQGTCGVPADAKAFSLNVTVVPNGPLSYLSLWPAGQGRPLVSTLNSFAGRIVANAALVPAGVAGAVTVFAANETHVILDINGYFR